MSRSRRRQTRFLLAALWIVAAFGPLLGDAQAASPAPAPPASTPPALGGAPR